jgi:transcriptional regulator with XRE-family HTH domain
MTRFGELIRQLRVENGYPLRIVAAKLNIDQAILCNIERGQRKANKEQINILANFFNYDEKKLKIVFLSDIVAYELIDEEDSVEVLKVAEEKIKYLRAKNE